MPATLSIPATHESLSQVPQWLAGLKHQHGWSRRSLFILQLALEELLINTLDYGYRQARDVSSPNDHQIVLSVTTTPNDIVLTIQDDGAAFDPTQHTLQPLAASLDEANVGGQGLRLIRHYFDEIHYRRDADHNHLRLKLTR